jgi:hypothetical protein
MIWRNLTAFSLKDDGGQTITGDADHLSLAGEDVGQGLGHLELRILEPQKGQHGVLECDGDGLPGLHRQTRVRGRGEHVQMGKHENGVLVFLTTKHGCPKLVEHTLDDRGVHGTQSRMAAEKNTLPLFLQTIPNRRVDVEGELLVALDEDTEILPDLFENPVDVLSIGKLHRLLVV